MNISTLRRTAAVGSFAVIGSALAFLMGASIGHVLDHQVNALSLGNTPIPVLAAQVHAARGPAVSLAQK